MENIKRRSIETLKTVKCPRLDYDPTSLEECRNCAFHKSDDGDKVECWYDRSLMLGTMHVTRFETGRYVYEARRLDKKTYDENKERIDADGGDCCCLCCFNQELGDGNEYCLLRQSANNAELHSFMCYEDEYWTERKDERYEETNK